MDPKIDSGANQSALMGHLAGEPPPAFVRQPPEAPAPAVGLFGGGNVIPLKQVPMEQRWDQVEQALARAEALCQAVEKLCADLTLVGTQLQDVQASLEVLQEQVQEDLKDRGR